jgi:hypothetical protein
MRLKCFRSHGFTRAATFIALLSILWTVPASALKEGKTEPMSALVPKHCKGADCAYLAQRNAILFSAGRVRASKETLCKLGDSRLSDKEIYANARNFCRNTYFEGSERFSPNAFDQKFSDHLQGDTTEAKAKMLRLIGNDRYFPHAIFSLVGENYCGYWKISSCVQTLRQDYVGGKLSVAELVLRTINSLENLPEPKVLACTDLIISNNPQLFGPSTSQQDAFAYCTTALRLTIPREIYHQESSPELEDQLNKQMDQIKLVYAKYFFIYASKAQEFFARVSERTSAKAADPYDFKLGPYADAGWEYNRKIVFTPAVTALRNAHGGDKNLWLMTAHEMGHQYSVGNGRFLSEILDWAPLGKSTIAQCSAKLLKIKHKTFMKDRRTQREGLADYLAAGAFGYGLEEIPTLNERAEFAQQAASSFCMFINTSGSWEWNEFEKTGVRTSPYGHALTWNRIGFFFANNRVRRALGCEEFTGPENECHNWE